MAKNRLRIEIYGRIGKVYDWYTGESMGNSFDDVREEIKNFTGKKIDVYINSEGGSVLEAESIASALQGSKAYVTSHIVGYTISSATIITLAADNVIMAENAWFMIHNPSNSAHGDVNEMRKNMNLLEAFTEKLAKLYVDKTGETIETVRAWMDEEKWFTADEAIAAGLVDETSKGINIAACLNGTQPIFKSTPEAVKLLLIQNNLEMKFKDFTTWVTNTLGITVSDKATTIEEAQAEVKAALDAQKGDKGASIDAVKKVLQEFDKTNTEAITNAIKLAVDPVEAKLATVTAENVKLVADMKAFKGGKSGGDGDGDGAEEDAGGEAGGKATVDAEGNTTVKADWWDKM